MLKYSPELKLTADAHEEEVITKDSYGIKPLIAKDPNIEYVVDIGGNIGAFSVHIQRLIPNAKIIVCEPEPSMMVYIKENTDNKLIYVEKAVIGDPILKEVKFNICKWEGNHHVDGVFNMEAYGPVGSRILHSITVPAITLKEIVDQNGFTRIDLLKIDTEGCEPAILQSIKPWIKNIKYIIGEWHSQRDLAIIKDVLKDTHNTTFTDGFFKEPATGLPANGNIMAIIK
jgi:FkbM family methyltransferase